MNRDYFEAYLYCLAIGVVVGLVAVWLWELGYLR